MDAPEEDRLRRALADADNARKLAERQAAELRQAERHAVSAAWLPVLDHLDAALRHAEADPESIVDGVRRVRQEAEAVLARSGYPPIEAVGEAFDPYRHEAGEVVRDTDAPPGTVVWVLRPGYGTTEDLLRPAVVAVSDGGTDAG